MNAVVLIGRITKDPELRYNTANKAVTRFTLAVNRKFINDKGEREADFISCVAWNKTAELICQYFKKGNLIGVEGRIQTGSYEKEDGTKTYMTDVIVNQIEFLEKKSDGRPDPEYAEPERSNAEPQEEEDPFAAYGDSVEIDDNFLE